MNNLSGPIILEEDAKHFLVAIHYNDRHLAREIPGRTWDGGKRRWAWSKTLRNYNNLINAFGDIATRNDISDKNLEREGLIEDESSDSWDECNTADDSGSQATTRENQHKDKLQNIEDKIDILIKTQENIIEYINESHDRSNEVADIEQTNSCENSRKMKDLSIAIDVITTMSNDESFNSILREKTLKQSPVQRIHNAIRDEIIKYNEITQEQIDEILTRRFLKNNQEYYKTTHAGLKQLIWVAQEEKYYAEKTKGHLNIYHMLNMFNELRNILEKSNEMESEMASFYTLLCLLLGKITWDRIRLTDSEISQ